jgi:hypothetical protein
MGIARSRLLATVHGDVVVDDAGVTCSEACDNPHGVNSECRCSKRAWLERDDDGARCRSILSASFGEGAVAEVDALFGLAMDSGPRRDSRPRPSVIVTSAALGPGASGDPS